MIILKDIEEIDTKNGRTVGSTFLVIAYVGGLLELLYVVKSGIKYCQHRNLSLPNFSCLVLHAACILLTMYHGTQLGKLAKPKYYNQKQVAILKRLEGYLSLASAATFILTVKLIHFGIPCIEFILISGSWERVGNYWTSTFNKIYKYATTIPVVPPVMEPTITEPPVVVPPVNVPPVTEPPVPVVVPPVPVLPPVTEPPVPVVVPPVTEPPVLVVVPLVNVPPVLVVPLVLVPLPPVLDTCDRDLEQGFLLSDNPHRWVPDRDLERGVPLSDNPHRWSRSRSY
ncbi:hypothetical protein TorRG33x02_106860 [Trema orientale]|uniref:Uncharacterized protein n=1 Tax=Trema orientale TaxID=63057 RepID=A0A2P5F6I1_TREOI|nr:hypothetical protein TorRG33x02_106860 [Trema orientale]